MTHGALIIQQPVGAARQLVLLFHGLGADAEDLGPVGQRLATEYPQALVVSLRAPHPCDFGFGYQWISTVDLDDARTIERVRAEIRGSSGRSVDGSTRPGSGPRRRCSSAFRRGR